MIGITILDRVSNEELYKRIGLPLVVELIRKRQLSWLGHALRRENDEISKVFALYIPEQDLRPDKRGAPKLSYREYITKVIRTCFDVEEPVELGRLVKNRACWKNVVAACSKAAE